MRRGRFPRGRGRWSHLLTVASLACVLASSACGEDPPDDYTQENGDAFLQACTEPLGDNLLHIQLCQCVFEKSQRQIPYDEFVRIETKLSEDPAVVLPPELITLIADCVVDITEL